MSYSLQRRMLMALSLSAVAIIVIAAIVSTAVSYANASDEQDEQLKMVAELAAQSSTQLAEIDDEDDAAAALFIAAPGSMIRPKDQSPELRLSADVPEGFSTLELAGSSYRLYTAQRSDATGHISALQRRQVLVEAAVMSLATAVLPLMVSVILIWLVIRTLIRNTFRSIGEIGHQLVSTAGPAAARRDTPTELLPFIEELQTAWQHQRLVTDGRARFVSNVAHELRSPLAALALQIDNLAAVELSSEARERLDLVRGGLKRTSQLLQQLLDLGSIQQGTSDAAVIFDVAAVLREVIELVLPYATSRGIEFEVDRLDDIQLTGSSTALFMLLRNALDNAVRYSPIDSIIEVSVVRSDQHMVVLVADQGDGMDQADMERAFEPFFRSSRTHDESGSGLGLAIVAEAAALLGGTARLKPRKQKGMTFEYCQPLDETATNPSLVVPVPLNS